MPKSFRVGTIIKKLMKKIILIFISSLLLTACSKSDELSGGGTFKVTASNGTTKTFNMADNGGILNGFAYHVLNTNLNNINKISMLLYGSTDIGNGMISLNFVSFNLIQIGKEYDYTSNNDYRNVFEDGVTFQFSDWIDSDNANTSKATVIFSSFQYPGRITGTAINYDKDGKILAKAEFNFNSIEPNNQNATTSTSTTNVTDIDGNIYHTIKIGTQTWMVENLKTTKYRNGDLIPNVTDNTWSKLNSGAYCVYNNSSTNDLMYGKLYNFYAVSDIRNIAPKGWHVPSDAEFTILLNYVSFYIGNSISIAKSLASTNEWTNSTYYGVTGCDLSLNNSSGFSALPGGYRDSKGNFVKQIGNYCAFASSTTVGSNWVYERYIRYDISTIIKDASELNGGYSIRCLKD